MENFPSILMKETLILIFLKFPEAGKVKTRLATTIGDQAAAIVYRRLVRDVLTVVSQAPADGVRILFDPPERENDVKSWIDAEWPGDPAVLQFEAQAPGDLGVRLAQGFQNGLDAGFQKIAAIGTDCVKLTADDFTETWKLLDTTESVFGPTDDGGYYLVGLKSLDARIFDVPWSAETTLAKSLDRAEEIGWKTGFLNTRTDIDTIDEWTEQAREIATTAPISDEPIVFQPVYQPKTWGGRRLADWMGRNLPAEGQIGESWELVDRPEAQTVVREGEFAGLSLGDLWKYRRRELFGRGLRSERFPLLFKILDAKENLSIQVHPPAGVAKELRSEPKTEIWYVAHAEPGAKLYAGLKNGVSAEDFEASTADGSTANLVHELEPQTGDFLLVEAGRVHSIGAGNLIYEIQDNSDTTYRVFDWNRQGLDGKPRDLHIPESLRSIDFNDFEPELDRPNGAEIANCPHFHIDRLEISPGETCQIGGTGQFCVIIVVAGSVTCGTQTFAPGRFFMIPAAASEALKLEAASDKVATILRTTLPMVKTPPSGHDGFYAKLRQRILTWADTNIGKESRYLKYILLVPDVFHLLSRLVVDPDVPTKHKAALGFAIAYFISPIDLMPEAILGPVGFLDDLVLSAYVVNQLLNDVDPEIVRGHWAGEGDALVLVQQLIAQADEMVGTGLWEKLKGQLKR